MPNGTTASGATRSMAAGSATSGVPQNWQFADSRSLSVRAPQFGQMKAGPSSATGLAARRASSANACSRTAVPAGVTACRFPQWPHAITPAAGSQAMVDPQFWHGNTVVPLVMLSSPSPPRFLLMNDSWSRRLEPGALRGHDRVSQLGLGAGLSRVRRCVRHVAAARVLIECLTLGSQQFEDSLVYAVLAQQSVDVHRADLAHPVSTGDRLLLDRWRQLRL